LHFIEEEIIHNNQARAKEQFNDRVILDHSYYTHKTNDQDVASFTVFGLAKNFNSFRRFSSCCHLAVCSKWRQPYSISPRCALCAECLYQLQKLIKDDVLASAQISNPALLRTILFINSIYLYSVVDRWTIVTSTIQFFITPFINNINSLFVCISENIPHFTRTFQDDDKVI
jgi:hypothetical protein